MTTEKQIGGGLGETELAEIYSRLTREIKCFVYSYQLYFPRFIQGAHVLSEIYDLLLNLTVFKLRNFDGMNGVQFFFQFSHVCTTNKELFFLIYLKIIHSYTHDYLKI